MMGSGRTISNLAMGWRSGQVKRYKFRGIKKGRAPWYSDIIIDGAKYEGNYKAGKK